MHGGIGETSVGRDPLCCVLFCAFSCFLALLHPLLSSTLFSHLRLAILDPVWMVLWPTRIAVVFVRSDFAVAEPDTGTVLPHLANLALNHDALMVYASKTNRDMSEELKTNQVHGDLCIAADRCAHEARNACAFWQAKGEHVWKNES